MNHEVEKSGVARLPIFVPFYYGWFIVALSFLANLTAAGIRSAPSVLIHPLEAEFGWSRTAIASAASLNLLLLGVFAPIGGWLIVRRCSKSTRSSRPSKPGFAASRPFRATINWR